MRHKIRWTSEKISRRIELVNALTYQQRREIPPFRCRYLSDPMDKPLVDPDFDDSSWELINSNGYWVSPRTNFILRTRFTLSGFDPGAGSIALYLPIGIAGDFSHPEALVYIDGVPYAACDRHHQEVILPEGCFDGEEHALALHGWSGIGGSTVGDLTTRLKMNPCEVVQIHQPTRDFLALTRVAHGITERLEDRDPSKHHILSTLDDAFKTLDMRNPIGAAFFDSIPKAHEILTGGLKISGSALDVEVYAIGHAHIDVAWLWTLNQTRQKTGRTFHNVLRLMEQYPNYIFAQSQPQLYDYLLTDFPGLFEEIKKRANEGRWEILGGMWVEADCNISGPESLARQFLLGRNFFRSHFGEGVDSPVLWLPDVFGYAWNLPQLIKEAGLTYFFTIKIGWNQYNRFPYDSFWWQGLDGTKVLTHFSTTKDAESVHAATYNSKASPSQVIGTWMNFQQKDYGPVGKIPPLLMSYGYGDGGGGPTREMLENIREMANFPSTPKIKSGKVADFFKKLETVSENLPTWNGELYLEYHRGTYTTQARNKLANRKSEFMLHDSEFLAAFASILDPGYKYPFEQLRIAWQLVCLNQFHDIIPGSSIAPVYEESLVQYSEVRRIAEDIRNTSLKLISSFLYDGPIVINPTSFSRDDVIDIDGEIATISTLEPFSIKCFNSLDKVTALDITSPVHASPSHLENDFIRVEINPDGDITRIYDRLNDREILPENAVGNMFMAFEDNPLNWDAWDIDIFYDDKVWFSEPASSVKLVEASPYRAVIEINRQILNSDYAQRISISYNNPRIDFFTHINWQEQQILLKVAFPVDILSPTATYEIQWGNVQRPTHRNTSWDWARFETAAQKWVDLSEGDYGVSLLNDCKYGNDIQDNVIRLTLLRGTTVPDPGADQGEHEFKYSLFPHRGSWGLDTVREAYAINDPLIISQVSNKTEKKKASSSLPPLVYTNRSNIIIETIKRAEDGNGIIIRLYEYQRQRNPFSINTIFPMVTAWRTNILEENREEIAVDDNTLNYVIKPYQILTFRLIPVENWTI